MGSLALNLIKNSFIVPDLNPPSPKRGSYQKDSSIFNNNGGSKDPLKNISQYQLPVPPSRQVISIEDWRDAIIESEKPILPYRVKMQSIFRDTILNPHVEACIKTRKELTLLRDFEFMIDGKRNDEWTKYFVTPWFYDFINYSLDAIFFGYTLVSIGDMIEENFPELTIIRRDLISPERKHVAVIPYDPSGFHWDSPEYEPYHLWIPTPTVNGTNSCGEGLLYTVALREINLRNLYGFNMDFLEMFGSPYRALFMENATDPTERGKAMAALNNQGGNNWGIFGKDDKLDFVAGAGGSGWKSYSEAQMRWQQDISKVILGHADALDSTPGKLGSGQGGGKNQQDHSPVKDALVNKEKSDENFITSVINNLFIPKLRFYNEEIPENLTFRLMNSEEEEETNGRKLELNIKMSEIAKNLIGTGYEIDREFFEESTGIKVNKSNATLNNNE